jgi:hypothetical protein
MARVSKGVRVGSDAPVWLGSAYGYFQEACFNGDKR